LSYKLFFAYLSVPDQSPMVTDKTIQMVTLVNNLLPVVLFVSIIIAIVAAIYFAAKSKRVEEQFGSLINSLNDIIFEFDETKTCLNVWFNNTLPRVIDPKQSVGKKLAEVIGPEKARKFDDALDKVIATRKPATVEFISDFGTGEWFIATLSPVIDVNGNYTGRISAALTNISAQKKYEHALTDNQALLLEAQTISKTGNWWYDHNTRETYWSENLYNILEIAALPPGINKLDYYLTLVHQEDREETRDYFLTLHKADAAPYAEHKLTTPTGKTKYVKVYKGSESNLHPKRISGVVQDVTESRLAEKAIKISRAELLEAQTIAKIGNWRWDRNSKIISWSDEIAQIFDIEEKATTELGAIKMLLHYTDRHDRKTLQRFLKSAALINNYPFVIKINTPQGRTKHVSIIAGKLMPREDGSTRKVIGTAQDITERKEAEIAYKRSENKYHLVLETIKLAALSLDKDGNITFCNQYLANLLGYEQRDLLGRNWLDFVPDEHKEVIKGWYANNAVKAHNVNPVICKNGELRTISWQNTASYDDDANIFENTAIGEDITDRQKATQKLISEKELAERSSEFKSEFLSIMSHEIRTPMNAVIGTTNLLLSEDPKPEQADYLNILKFSADNLLAIINDILDYNKIEAGKLELNVFEFNIYQLVQKIRKSFYSKAVEKILDIDLDIDKTIPEFLLGDQIRLGQILNNLVSNAVKFTQKGSVGIRLINEQMDDHSIAIKFMVTDTGIGIDPKNLQMIFDPFTQETQFINSTGSGTGLGLAITKRLIELHQSEINVHSELGKGTEFWFTILFELPNAQDASNRSKVPDSLMLNLHGMNILLVDDNKMNLLIAARFLKKWQANVDEAFDGREAVEMVKNKAYDLVIMDLQMPVMDGFEATSIIKSAYPQIPVIALTANAMPETQHKALASGMSDYLTKPFVPNVFFEKVSKFYKPVV